MIGTKLAHYEITSHLGTGGMGEVYQATDSKLRRSVAIKLLPAAFASDPDRLSRFRREAQLLATLNHPNIAQIYGLEESGDTRCIVMELVEGETLHALITKGPIPEEETLRIAPTLVTARQATNQNVMLGTAAYMSPEQARGKSVDKRTDIWAFGAVLFEILTGRQVFGGETVTDTLAAVLAREPDFTALPAITPPAITR